MKRKLEDGVKTLPVYNKKRDINLVADAHNEKLRDPNKHGNDAFETHRANVIDYQRRYLAEYLVDLTSFEYDEEVATQSTKYYTVKEKIFRPDGTVAMIMLKDRSTRKRVAIEPLFFKGWVTEKRMTECLNLMALVFQ